MNFFRKRSGALLVLVLAVAVGIGIGQLKRPYVPGIDANGVPTEFSYVYDYADILSADTEAYITRMNNGLYSLTGGQIAVVTVRECDESLYDYAMELGSELGVGDSRRSNGLVLLLDTEQGDDNAAGAVAVQGDGIYYDLDDDDITQILVSYLQEPFYAHNYDEGVIDTFNAFLSWYENYYGVDILPSDTVQYDPVEEPLDAATMIVFVIFTIVLLFVIWWLLDYARYKSYRRRYWQPGMGVPPVVYRPIFWGHHMGWRPPPPPPPGGPRPPQQRHDHRDPPGGFGGGNHHGGGFGGTPPRNHSGGGSFGNAPHGNSRGGGFGNRSGNSFGGGSFGGASRGNSHGGGFGGGSRGGFGGGGFSGGSRGGGFGGGGHSGASRGGGFGGHR